MIATGWPTICLDRLQPRLSTEPGRVDLWSIPLGPADRAIENLTACISADERGRADRFVFDEHRRRYIVAHAGLRLLLSRYTGVEAGALDFVAGPQGKPSLAPLAEIAFNLSHSAELAVVAVAAPTRLGVDIEHLREVTDAAAIAHSFFSEAEGAALADTTPAERDRAFLTCWTRKEAFVKALGGGLSVDLTGFAVNLSRERPAFLTIEDPALATVPWSIIHIEPDAGYLGAAVVEGAACTATFACLDLGTELR
jgi:4'-phosphopantetheinyl transferase